MFGSLAPKAWKTCPNCGWIAGERYESAPEVSPATSRALKPFQRLWNLAVTAAGGSTRTTVVAVNSPPCPSRTVAAGKYSPDRAYVNVWPCKLVPAKSASPSPSTSNVTRLRVIPLSVNWTANGATPPDGVGVRAGTEFGVPTTRTATL